MSKRRLILIIAIFLIIVPGIVFMIMLIHNDPYRTTIKEKKEAQKTAADLAGTEWLTENLKIIQFNSEGTAATDSTTGELYMERDEKSPKVWRVMQKVVNENGEMIGFEPTRFLTIKLSADENTLDVTTHDGLQWHMLSVEQWTKRQGRQGNGSSVS